MRRNIAMLSLGVVGVLAAGCATNMHGSQAKVQEADALKTQVAALETKVDELNQRIADISQRQEVAQAAPTPSYSTTATKRQIARHGAAEAAQAQTKLAAGATLSSKQTQLALKSAGFYNGPVDGKFGVQTKDAVKAFQKSKGLNPDGVVGNRTAAALAKMTTAESAGSTTEENQ